MQLTFHGHACVGITLPDGARLTLDPGSLSDDTALTDATAVLVTHDHIDHLDPAPVVEHLRTRTDARLWAPPSAVEALVAAGAPAERVQAVSPGTCWRSARRGSGSAGACTRRSTPTRRRCP
nr:hypothetical protein GCM10025730_04710 [Promicromonospora thailandica]